MPISSIASITCLKALRMLLKMMHLHSSFSFFENPCAYIRRICFNTVDFPDSPAPVTQLSVSVVLFTTWDSRGRCLSLQPIDSWFALTQEQKLNLAGGFLLVSTNHLVDFLVLRHRFLVAIVVTTAETHGGVLEVSVVVLQGRKGSEGRNRQR